MTASFAKLMTVTASTKRSPAFTGTDPTKKRGVPVANITSLLITPLDPMGGETQGVNILATPVQLYECFTESGQDIINGDVLTVSSRDYSIRAVENWTYKNGTYLHLIVEDMRR